MKKQSLKCHGDFYIEIASLTGDYYCENGNQFICSDDGRTIAYLNGVVYCNEADFKHLIELDISNLATKLEGFFSLVVIKNNEVYIITDRSNSHKVFYKEKSNGTICISTDFERLIPLNYKLDVGGTINFIVNNCLINDKTIIQGIKFVPAATIMSFNNTDIDMRQYFAFKYYDYLKDEQDVKEVQSALQHGIDSLVGSIESAVLAMSGGWDARGIMFYLTRQSGVKINSFSYKDSNYDTHADTDADISFKIAKVMGVDHKTVQLYNGDFIGLLIANANIGKCISAFCYELDAFQYIASCGFKDIIFGDHIFGYGKRNITIRSKEDVLQQIAIYKSLSTKSLRKLFKNKEIYYASMKALDEEVDLMYSQANEVDSFTDKKDYLYFQQRVLNLIMPLRQMIGGLVGYVHIPFMHNDAINVCQHISTEGRIDKSLYKKALIDEFPALFNIPYAKNSGRGVDWDMEISKSRSLIKNRLDYYPIELEKIFPKQVVEQLIEEICANRLKKRIRSCKSFITAGAGYMRRRFNSVEKVANFIFGPHCGRVDYITILINALYVREFLEKIERVNAAKE